MSILFMDEDLIAIRIHYLHTKFDKYVSISRYEQYIQDPNNATYLKKCLVCLV